MLVASAVVFLLLSGCASDKPAGNIKSVTDTSAAPLADKGSIAGLVMDSEAVALPGAAVILFGGTETGEDLRATSDASGRFTFNGLQPQVYRLIADLAGYSTKTINVQVNAGEIAKAEFLLDKVVVRVIRPDFYFETNGTIQGPVIAFQGPRGDESTYHKVPVEPVPLSITANLTWPCGTLCIGPPETNYLNLEIIDSDKVAKRCTDQKEVPNNRFLLTCRMDSFAAYGEYQVRVFAWEGRDVAWNLKVLVDN